MKLFGYYDRYLISIGLALFVIAIMINQTYAIVETEKEFMDRCMADFMPFDDYNTTKSMNTCNSMLNMLHSLKPEPNLDYHTTNQTKNMVNVLVECTLLIQDEETVNNAKEKCIDMIGVGVQYGRAGLP
jgi:hypothetical protein